MCPLPPSQVVDGVPYTESIVYPPFIGAATAILSNKPSPCTPPQPPPPPNPPTIPAPEQPYWRLQQETVRVVSEPLPDTFSEIPNYTIKFVSNSSEDRHNNDLRIYEGINVELLYGACLLYTSPSPRD